MNYKVISKLITLKNANCFKKFLFTYWVFHPVSAKSHYSCISTLKTIHFIQSRISMDMIVVINGISRLIILLPLAGSACTPDREMRGSIPRVRCGLGFSASAPDQTAIYEIRKNEALYLSGQS
ncbi:hypothetical protein Echvi_3646 [Echinicola vietnamensis DSM 17526]|uniref:Uncharacterized protein n=1 Tax=Echinicola vietnamensis (strain DSM 17526 / LMG 23754 / KMM 6221) TaxID=926556 RepID=L0G4B6_ECHVK|nr:hypothetical protein Echvi_3646 [Echinicola vietnamensis DSM 17526]